MKRTHTDDQQNKNKRFSYPSTDNVKKPNMSPSASYGYSYQTSMNWVDPRNDPRNQHGTLGLYNQWNSNTATGSQSFPPAVYNPMQPPPPPLPMERPPDAPPPPPPHGLGNMAHMGQSGLMRRPQMSPNMRRRPPMGSGMPGPSGYMNTNPYKRNDRFQNNPKNGGYNHLNPNAPGSSGMMKPKGDKLDDSDKPKPALKVNKKARRKPMSERYTCKKEWNKDDAVKALTLENAYNHLIKKVPMLILRFPDPELNKGLIHSYSPAIETVHFQQPSRARYCFVQLKPDADIEAVKEQISQIEFGTGRISVENKVTRHEVAEVTPEQLDPYTLYVGNLPTKLNVTIFKEKFPTAKRIDIGYAQRTKFTRYAFLHYDNVDESMEAFKSTYNLTIDARSLVVRFRRNKGSVGLSEKGKKTQKTEGDDGKKEATKDPTKHRLFDDEWNVYENKDNVMEKAEELRKAGFAESSSTTPSLFGSKIKVEPIDPVYDDEDDCMSDEYGDGYAAYDGDGYDEDETFCQSDYEGSENEYAINDVIPKTEVPTEEIDESQPEQSEETDEAVAVIVKTEQPDDYVETSVVAIKIEKRADELDDLFSDLNPEDETNI